MYFLKCEFWLLIIGLLILLKIIRNVKIQNCILLIASYGFYLLIDAQFLPLLFINSFCIWFFGKKIQEGIEHSSHYLVIGISMEVLILCYFKYCNFFVENISSLLGMNLYVARIVMPIGISFYTFQAISYLADIYSKKIEAEKSLINVLLYIGFFAQIVSGPIVKAHDFIIQLKRERRILLENLSIGTQKIVLGLFKKMVIADRLGVCVDTVYSAPMAYNGASLLLAVMSYSLQIYYDFSGYSDIAIGIADMLDIKLGENFNLPYMAKNPSEFWNRWHISLSSWFREYVYIPLGGNRKGRIRTYINLFVTMLLSGIWHGASLTFVLWGILHAIWPVGHKIVVEIFGERKNCEFTNIIYHILTFGCVAILWIPFRTESISKSILILQRIFSWNKGKRTIT